MTSPYARSAPPPSDVDTDERSTNTVRVRGPKLPSARGGYTGIIAAEFAGCVVVIGLTTLTNNPDSPTVSAGEAMVRLTAVCVVFFILALLGSGPNTGRIAAAFGGLVLAGSAVNAAASWQTLAKVFSGGGQHGGTNNVSPQGGHHT